MAATPVTVKVWKEYCLATGFPLPTPPVWGLLDDHPVVNVSWVDIMGWDGKSGFCEWVNSLADGSYSLPTEAQFEYCARGGVDGMKYPWGNYFSHSKLWCSMNQLGDAKSTNEVTRSVRKFVNSFELSDMAGNVWQWCSDWFEPYTVDTLPENVRRMTVTKYKKVCRGSCWSDFGAKTFECHYRGRSEPTHKSHFNGFRLAAVSF